MSVPNPEHTADTLCTTPQRCSQQTLETLTTCFVAGLGADSLASF